MNNGVLQELLQHHEIKKTTVKAADLRHSGVPGQFRPDDSDQ